jgi:soluble lytic murein transglycosylase-like protein
MRRAKYFLLVLILLSCTESPRTARGTSSGPLTSEVVSYLLSEKPREVDTGLYLYDMPLTRTFLQSFYTRFTHNPEVTREILGAAAENGIPLSLAFALAWTESDFRTKAVSRNRGSVDRGLFQLNSRSFPALREEDFYNPRINARYGLSHLRYCLQVGESEVVALAMYNAGINRVRAGTPYSTLQHVAQVFEYRKQLDSALTALLANPVEIDLLLTQAQSLAPEDS